jgi:hypothetical protein
MANLIKDRRLINDFHHKIVGQLICYLVYTTDVWWCFTVEDVYSYGGVSLWKTFTLQTRLTK